MSNLIIYLGFGAGYDTTCIVINHKTSYSTLLLPVSTMQL